MTPRARRSRLLLVALAAASLPGGCHKEKRRIAEPPAAGTRAAAIQVGDLQPGPKVQVPATTTPYEENAYGISEGQRLYSWFNCVGCHAHGGGSIGPPLMDSQWIYGSDPANIFASIVEGRPNGMPAFRGKIADHQVWQLVAYVRSLGGLQPQSVTPVRSDHLQARRHP